MRPLRHRASLLFRARQRFADVQDSGRPGATEQIARGCGQSHRDSAVPSSTVHVGRLVQYGLGRYQREASGFPSLRTLVMGFACQDDMRHFTEDVVKNYIPSFLDRLRVAAWDPSGGASHDGSWLRVIPTKDTEGELHNVQYGSRGPDTWSDTPSKLEDSGIPVLQKVYSMV